MVSINDLKLLIAQIRGEKAEYTARINKLNAVIDVMYAELKMRQGTELHITEEQKNG
jgi:hypothetical protein